MHTGLIGRSAFQCFLPRGRLFGEIANPAHNIGGPLAVGDAPRLHGPFEVAGDQQRAVGREAQARGQAAAAGEVADLLAGMRVEEVERGRAAADRERTDRPVRS